MDILKNLKSRGKLCSGCSACFNTCPVNAIDMLPDNEGFLYPQIDQSKCIDCGKCERTCPVLNPQYNNSESPDCFAMKASDAVRKSSASGGFVSSVAYWILNQGGVVFGAVWSDDWTVRHIKVDTEKDFAKIQGSKYQQSNVGNTYKEAKEYLKQGRYVLYTGVPCQIAGLYAYLGNDVTEKLYTIDVLCHGTPSSKVFRKYIDDMYGSNAVENINFRDKQHFSWGTGIEITMKTNETVHVKHGDDIFYKAFLPCMSVRPSCSQCSSSRLPRQADFSCGDFWGLKKNYPQYHDQLGTSFVLVNNSHASAILKKISPTFKLWEKVDINHVISGNKTIIHPFKAHPGRKHFFSILDQKPFHEAVEASLNHHYDIGIVGLWYGINYGSVLTYYALYSLLRNLGYDPVMLPKPNGMWPDLYNNMDTLAQRFIWKHCNVFVPFRRIEEYPRVNDLCDDFIIGSDVVWNYKVCGHESGQFFFLDWVEKGRKKIAYAASLGQTLTGPDTYVQQAIYNLQQFDAISCREERGVEELTRMIPGQNIAHVLDPVFVCNPAIYEEVLKDMPVDSDNPTVFGYFLNTSCGKEKKSLLTHAAEKFHARQIISVNPNPTVSISKLLSLYGENSRADLSVEEWLFYIKNSNFYVGDSYHGLCFALIFHVPFYIVYVPMHNYTVARFESLLHAVGLEHRMSKDMNFINQNYQEIVDQEIDWDEVDRRLDVWRKESKDWLIDALKKDPKPMQPEDYVYNHEKRQTTETIVQLRDEIDSLKRSVNQIQKQQVRHEQGSWLVRKLKGGIQCYKDNGLRYTWVHFWEKVGKKLRRK